MRVDFLHISFHISAAANAFFALLVATLLVGYSDIDFKSWAREMVETSPLPHVFIVAVLLFKTASRYPNGSVPYLQCSLH